MLEGVLGLILGVTTSMNYLFNSD